MAEHSPAQSNQRVGDVGEFGLIARLQERVAARRPPAATPGLELSIGDDAACWRPAPGARQVITTDALVQDVHFETATTSWRDLGWKALAVNVSDIAAMGARPRLALVTLALPRTAQVGELLELYDGMLDLAVEFEVGIVGGDVVSSAVLMLNVTVVGETAGPLLRRDAGRPGDLLAVTGTLGASAGGLRLLQAGERPTAPDERLLAAHLRPRPRVEEAALLVAHGLRCAMDVSDGLLGDSAHLCEQSGVGAEIEVDRVPVEPRLRQRFGPAALDLAIGGGEDYELLCAGPSECVEAARAALAERGVALSTIGRLTPAPAAGPLVRLVDATGAVYVPRRGSWDHFRA